MKVHKLYAVIIFCFFSLSIYGQETVNTVSKTNTTQHISIVRTYNNLKWGANKNKLYISKNSGKKWYLENNFDFSIEHLKPINDSAALIRDISKNHYTYSLTSHSLAPYELSTPLHGFLSSPINTLSIKVNSNGCEYAYEDGIEYLAARGGVLKINGPIYLKNSNKRYTNTLSRQNLSNLIRFVSNRYSRKMTIEDFGVTYTDKLQYQTIVDSLFNSTPSKKQFYLNILSKLDTISSETLYEVYNNAVIQISTSSITLSIKIVNTAGQVISIEKRYYHNSTAWHLPLVISFDGMEYNCYDVTLAKYIKQNTPDDLTGNEYLNNKHLILMIGNYFYDKATR